MSSSPLQDQKHSYDRNGSKDQSNCKACSDFKTWSKNVKNTTEVKISIASYNIRNLLKAIWFHILCLF